MKNKNFSTAVTALMIIMAVIGYVFTLIYFMLCPQ